MPKDSRLNKWKGSEKKLYRGEPVLRFIYPPRSSNKVQTSWANWNYKDCVLTVSYWHDYSKALDSSRTTSRLNASLRNLFKPQRQMCVIDNRVIKKDNTVLANIQYFARLDQCPTEAQMTELANIIENDVEFISVTQLVQQRLSESAKKSQTSYYNKQRYIKGGTDED